MSQTNFEPNRQVITLIDGPPNRKMQRKIVAIGAFVVNSKLKPSRGLFFEHYQLLGYSPRTLRNAGNISAALSRISSS